MRVGHLHFRAAGYTPFSARWTQGSQLLAVDGVCQDQIDTVSEKALEHQAQDMDIVLEWLQVVEPLIRNRALGIDAFWQTLVGNQGRHICHASKKTRHAF